MTSMTSKALERATFYLKSWLKFNYERDDTPGFVVAIAHNGKVVFNEAFGYANLETKQKLTPQHLFRIASHSKTFTATAIMQQQEQGNLRIDDYVVDYLPWLKTHKDKRWQKVTIRQLLSHGAGVIRDGSNNDYWNVNKPFPIEDEFKKDILSADLVIDNNTKLKYSNFGYTLLGLLVSQVSGKPYNQYIIDNIVIPTGLKNTGPELTTKIKDRLVTGYSRLGPDKKRLPIVQINTQIMSSATGFYSDSLDICNYFYAHMVGSRKLLNDESKKEMQRIQWQAENTHAKIEYGLGFEIEHVNEHRLLGHGGGFPGHITKSYFDPEEKLVVTVLANAAGSWSTYMAKSVIKVLDYYQNNRQLPKWLKFEGRYMNLWGDTDIIAVGNKLVATSSYGWEPFDNPDELEHLNGNMFKVSKTDSFSSVDEIVEFKLDTSGGVTKVNYCGNIMLPEAKFIKKMALLKQIG